MLFLPPRGPPSVAVPGWIGCNGKGLAAHHQSHWGKVFSSVVPEMGGQRFNGKVLLLYFSFFIHRKLVMMVEDRHNLVSISCNMIALFVFWPSVLIKASIGWKGILSELPRLLPQLHFTWWLNIWQNHPHYDVLKKDMQKSDSEGAQNLKIAKVGK